MKEEFIMDFKEIAKKYQPELVKIRRDFHMHPELSLKEFRTKEKIIEFLKANNVEILPIQSHTSVVAMIRGEAGEGKTFAVRGDIDALPMPDKKDVPYKSTVENVMHSCGHDVHTTLLMGLALVMNEYKSELKGNVKLIFQAAEEIGAGAYDLMKKGVMDGVNGVFSFHVNNPTPAGCIAYRKGAVCASSEGFKITVTGLGGHGAHPHNCIDPVVIASQLVVTLQTIISRNIAGPQAGVITIGSIHGGTKSNIIADDVVLEGSLRTLDPNVRNKIVERMNEICKGFETTYNCKIAFEQPKGIPALINNDDFLMDYCVPALEKIVGKDKMIYVNDPSMGGEDFSFFTQLVPGAMCSLGSGDVTKPIVNGHNSMFDVDEECIWIGVACMAQIAADFLGSDQ